MLTPNLRGLINPMLHLPIMSAKKGLSGIPSVILARSVPNYLGWALGSPTPVSNLVKVRRRTANTAALVVGDPATVTIATTETILVSDGPSAIFWSISPTKTQIAIQHARAFQLIEGGGVAGMNVSGVELHSFQSDGLLMKVKEQIASPDSAYIGVNASIGNAVDSHLHGSGTILRFVDWSVATNRERVWDSENDNFRDPGPTGANWFGHTPEHCTADFAATVGRNRGTGADADVVTTSGDAASIGPWSPPYSGAAIGQASLFDADYLHRVTPDASVQDGPDILMGIFFLRAGIGGPRYLWANSTGSFVRFNADDTLQCLFQDDAGQAVAGFTTTATFKPEDGWLCIEITKSKIFVNNVDVTANPVTPVGTNIDFTAEWLWGADSAGANRADGTFFRMYLGGDLVDIVAKRDTFATFDPLTAVDNYNDGRKASGNVPYDWMVDPAETIQNNSGSGGNYARFGNPEAADGPLALPLTDGPVITDEFPDNAEAPLVYVDEDTAASRDIPIQDNAGRSGLVRLLYISSIGVINDPAGWRRVVGAGGGGSGPPTRLYVKDAADADGTDVTVTFGASVRCTAVSFLIEKSRGSAFVRALIENNPTSTSVDPPAFLDAFWYATKAMYHACATMRGGNQTPTVRPTDYVNGQSAVNVSGSGTSTNVDERQLDGTGDDPSAYTFPVTNLNCGITAVLEQVPPTPAVGIGNVQATSVASGNAVISGYEILGGSGLGDRVLCVVSADESNGGFFTTAVDFGGTALTELTDAFVGVGGGFRNELKFWYLLEANFPAGLTQDISQFRNSPSPINTGQIFAFTLFDASQTPPVAAEIVTGSAESAALSDLSLAAAEAGGILLHALGTGDDALHSRSAGSTTGVRDEQALFPGHSATSSLMSLGVTDTDSKTMGRTLDSAPTTNRQVQHIVNWGPK